MLILFLLHICYRLFILLRTQMVYHFLMAPITNHLMGYVFCIYFRMISFLCSGILFINPILNYYYGLFLFTDFWMRREMLRFYICQQIGVYGFSLTWLTFHLGSGWNLNPEMENKEQGQLSALLLVIKQSYSHLAWLYWVGIFPVCWHSKPKVTLKN